MTRFPAFLLACLLAACASTAPAYPPAASPPTAAEPASPAAPSEAPAALRFLEGRWEYTDPTNRYQMAVVWNPAAGRFEGTLAKQGDGSASVGFTIGELVWIATPAPDGTVHERQKYRSSPEAEEWRDGVVDLAGSTPEQLVTSAMVFARVP